MNQNELKVLFKKYSKENGVFNVQGEVYDYDKTFFIKNEKVYTIQKDNEYKYSGTEEYSIREINTKEEMNFKMGFTIGYQLQKAEEYIKFYNAFKHMKE